MASFNPDFKTPQDPSYIGYSRETSGKTSLSNLVKGTGDALVTGFNTVDEITQEQIKSEIKAGAGLGDPTSTAPAVDTPATDASTVTEETTQEDVFGSTQTAASPVPEVSQGGQRAAKLTEAYKQGKITATAYWGQMAALSKSLKARYTGYSDIIDKQFQGITGQVPADALANAQRTEVLKAAATAASEEKQFNTFVKTNIQYLPPDYFDRVRAGNPYSQLDTYSYVHKQRSTEHALNYQKDKLAVAHAQGNLQEEEAIGTAQNTLNTRADAILAEVGNANVIEAIRAAQASGSQVTPQQKEQIRAGFGQLKAKMEDALESELRKPSSDGSQTFYSLIRDPGKVKAIKEQAMSRLNYIQQLVEDNQYGLLGAALNNVKAIQDDASNKLLTKDNYFALADAANKHGGGPLLTELFADPQMSAAHKKAGQAFLDLLAAKTAAGVPHPAIDKIKDAMDQPGVPAEDKKATARGSIDVSLRSITSENATQTSMVTAAKDLFGQENINFLAHFPAAQQNEYYGKLVSEPVTKKMFALKATSPQTWNNYREWAKASFIALQKSNAATIQEGVSQRVNVNLEWDEANNQFFIKPTQAGIEDSVKRSQGTDTFLSGPERAYSEDVVRAKDEMNKQIKILEGVLKMDGSNVPREIATLLGSMDIQMLGKKQKTFFQKAREAIDLKLNPPEATVK